MNPLEAFAARVNANHFEAVIWQRKYGDKTATTTAGNFLPVSGRDLSGDALVLPVDDRTARRWAVSEIEAHKKKGG